MLIFLLLFFKQESDQSCEKGWILYDKRCYIFSKSPVSFLDAMVRMKKLFFSLWYSSSLLQIVTDLQADKSFNIFHTNSYD